MSHANTNALSNHQAAEVKDADAAAFTFVGVPAADASSGAFDLLSWPEVVVQIRRTLEDQERCIEHLHLRRVLGA